MVKIKITEEETVKHTVQWDTVYFQAKFTKSQLESYGKKIQKLVDNRKEWAGELYKIIASKTRFVKNKDLSVDIDKLDYEESIIGFSEAFKNLVKLREEPVQQTIEEGIKGLKPGKKKAMLSLKDAEEIADSVVKG